MASPQPDQFTKLSNELLEVFNCFKMTDYERVVIYTIIRKTYGWGKKMDWISHGQISDCTGVSRPHVCRTITGLINKKIIKREGRKIGIQKDWEQWDVDWRVLPEEVTGVTSGGNRSVTSDGTHKRNKETITKESTPTMKKETYIDYESGEIKEVTKPKKTSNKEIISLVHLFEKQGEEHTGVKPDLTRGYFKIQQAMKSHSLSPDDVKSLFNHFFNNRKLTNEQKVGLSLCISGSYISQWKVSQKNKPVSQVDAASQIIL